MSPEGAERMEWQQLEYFRAVAQREHVTQAAEALSVSQSAVSRAIAQLEEELGVALFDRRGRAVALNRYGKLFLRYVDRARSELAEGRRALADAAGAEHGIVAFGFLHSLGIDVVPRMIRAFRKTYPEITFELHQNAGEALMEKLRDGSIDLCISVPGLFEHAEATWATFKNEELVASVPHDHPLATRGAIRLEELADEPFIALKHGHTLRVVVDAACARAGFTPRIAFEGEEVVTARGLVAAGLGIAVLPQAPEQREGTNDLPIRPKLRRRLGIGWLPDRYMSAATVNFRKFMLDWSRENLQ
jgi:DNA-binding transcriptional LysR family regulator